MKKTLFTIIGWAISIFFIALIITKINFSALWIGLKSANWFWLVFAAIINILVLTIKSLRWQWIMKAEKSLPHPHVHKEDKRIAFRQIFEATIIGFAGNNIFPARGGDVLKIYLLGRWTNARKTMLASVAILDKLFDGFTFIFLFGFIFIYARNLPSWVQSGALTMSIIITISFIICFSLLFYYKNEVDLSDSKKIHRVLNKLRSGLHILTRKDMLMNTILLSFVATFFQVVTLWACQRAFQIEMNLVTPILVFLAINLSFLIPSAPSGVGPFEAAAVVAYTWFGLKTETALNIALMYHAVQFFPVTILGFLFYLSTRNRSTTSHQTPF